MQHPTAKSAESCVISHGQLPATDHHRPVCDQHQTACQIRPVKSARNVEMKYLDCTYLPSYFQTKCVCFKFKYQYKIYHNFL
jgi:hypothetical protein